MPAPHPRRRRTPALAAALALFATVALAGCAGQRDPSSYTDSVKEHFVASCTSVAKADGVIDAPKDYCTCVYAKIRKDVPFGDFKKVNDDQREDPAKLPSSFTKAYRSCSTSSEG